MSLELLTTTNTDTDSEEEYTIDKIEPLQSKFILSVPEAQQPKADSVDMPTQAIINVWQSWLFKHAHSLCLFTPTLHTDGVTALADSAYTKNNLRYGIERAHHWVIRDGSRVYIRAELLRNNTWYRFLCSDIRHKKWTSMPLIHMEGSCRLS